MALKILILRFSSIGDIVLTSPLVRALKQQSDAQVHFVLKKRFYPVLQHNPYIDKIFTFEKEVSEILSQLKAENYDHIIDLHNNLRSARLKSFLRRPSHSFNKLNFEKWLLVNLKINMLPDVHIVDRYFDTVKFLNISYDGQGLDYFLSNEERRALDGLPENFKEKYVVFVVGGAHFTKQIPVKHLVEMAKGSSLPVVLLGGLDDVEKAQEVAVAAGDKVLNLAGKLSLNQSAAIIEKSRKVVTADTGLMHIAAAFHKQVISFWGNTVPRFGMYPLMPQGMEHLSQIVEVENLKCRPCSKIGYDKCPRKHFRCMMDIKLPEI